eukprot:5130138-Prymnesium_polylepis.1
MPYVALVAVLAPYDRFCSIDDVQRAHRRRPWQRPHIKHVIVERDGRNLTGGCARGAVEREREHVALRSPARLSKVEVARATDAGRWARSRRWGRAGGA